MQRLRSTFREHLHFIVVVTLLTLIMTFPTVVYVFKTDVFWLPTGGSNDVYIGFWDAWYGKQFLTGQGDRYYSNFIFYPKGVSLSSIPCQFRASLRSMCCRLSCRPPTPGVSTFF